MPETTESTLRTLPAAQAKELSLLVELEAQWENMRKPPSRPQHAGSVTQNLQGVQKAYDAFHSKLVAYNKRHTPAHVPELLLNTPSRLAIWCRAMRELYLQVEDDPQTRCPVQLVEKAYRCAERMSGRMNKECVSRPAAPSTVRAAIENLQALAQWCDALAAVAATV
jgi:hypothetical protein